MSSNHASSSNLETFPKLPLGGLDRRSLVQILAAQGPTVAREDLAAARATLVPQGVDLPRDACVLMLGGSNGILRSVAIQLLFAEKVPVYAVHYDSEKLQIGPHHARAIVDAAQQAGVAATFRNADATSADVIREVVAELKSRYRVVHLINGIAAGATKRYPEHGPTRVKDLDVAFDPVRQIPDFSSWEKIRRVGLVDVDVATPQDIERTNKMMGTSTELWTTPLADAGLLVRGESLVAFADYDYEPDDPVYAKGPLAGAKNLQRESMKRIAAQHGVRTVRLCYPAMNTTAIGAIPGGILMFAGTAQLLFERGTYRNLAALARDTMPLFARDFDAPELRLDDDYRAVLPAFHALADRLTNENLRESLKRVVGNPAL
jgi:enoyl-[acyl-carrier protein] reductase/trans-2-enoyl-CoA reductase (NAD+)